MVGKARVIRDEAMMLRGWVLVGKKEESLRAINTLSGRKLTQATRFRTVQPLPIKTLVLSAKKLTKNRWKVGLCHCRTSSCYIGYQCAKATAETLGFTRKTYAIGIVRGVTPLKPTLYTPTSALLY